MPKRAIISRLHWFLQNGHIFTPHSKNHPVFNQHVTDWYGVEYEVVDGKARRVPNNLMNHRKIKRGRPLNRREATSFGLYIRKEKNHDR